MKHDHQAEPQRLSDFLPSAMTAELLRCIARSLMATADQMDHRDGRQAIQVPVDHVSILDLRDQETPRTPPKDDFAF